MNSPGVTISIAFAPDVVARGLQSVYDSLFGIGSGDFALALFRQGKIGVYLEPLYLSVKAGELVVDLDG